MESSSISYRIRVLKEELAKPRERNVISFNRFGLEWKNFTAALESDFIGTVADLVGCLCPECEIDSGRTIAILDAKKAVGLCTLPGC